jgi:hypothetical protein
MFLPLADHCSCRRTAAAAAATAGIRCLERVISRRVVQLQQPADLADASADEVQRVQVRAALLDFSCRHFIQLAVRDCCSRPPTC